MYRLLVLFLFFVVCSNFFPVDTQLKHCWHLWSQASKILILKESLTGYNSSLFFVCGYECYFFVAVFLLAKKKERASVLSMTTILLKWSFCYHRVQVFFCIGLVVCLNWLDKVVFLLQKNSFAKKNNKKRVYASFYFLYHMTDNLIDRWCNHVCLLFFYYWWEGIHSLFYFYLSLSCFFQVYEQYLSYAFY
jgi:hypothetical protein